MILTNGNHDSFKVMVVGGATPEEVKEVLQAHFGEKVAVINNTDIGEVNENFVLETLQHMGLLSQMTRDQRERAYGVVKESYVIPGEVTQHIMDIINENWTEIVFGIGEEY